MKCPYCNKNVFKLDQSAKSFAFNKEKENISQMIQEGYSAEQIARFYKWSGNFLRLQCRLKLDEKDVEKLSENGRKRMLRNADTAAPISRA